MQQLSTDLANHLAQETTTLATCWSITRKDGMVLYFTDHDRDITVGGHAYLAAHTVTGTVTALEAAYAFHDSARTEPNTTFAYGLLTFTSGANNGIRMEVRDYTAGRFGLFLPMPNAIAIGDHYSVSAGCDKTFETCVGSFNNAVNFRGEPDVPGTDRLLETAATRST